MNKTYKLFFRFLGFTLAGASCAYCANQLPPKCTIINSYPKGKLTSLAAHEIQRYVYQRTGDLLPIKNKLPKSGDAIIISINKTHGKQDYLLKTENQNNRKILKISGGSDIAALYGAYDFAEQLGVRFYLHGDVIPDNKIKFKIPNLNITNKPLFNARGIQPFHDFQEGPDWWEADDYKAYFSQLAKLKMNFFGMHCYPEGGKGPEPLVWIGLEEDINKDGSVKHSYPSGWATTKGGRWGYGSEKTENFAAGAGLIFENDVYGHSIMKGYDRMPKEPEGCNKVFNETTIFMSNIFDFAHNLDIKICLGTETPLTIPNNVKKHLEEKNIDPGNTNTIRKLYEGMFKRIADNYPIDTYWLWTPEPWTWNAVPKENVDKTLTDIKIALEAYNNVGKPFQFATCGWVLGPPEDRTLFDKMLPTNAAISCINRKVGFDFVEPGFSQIKNRPKWAIPWLEDDPAMITPQFWAGRLRRDAADALAYGCTGLIGIHWRTKILAPNIAALADAAWDQKNWNKDFGKKYIPPKSLDYNFRVGGEPAEFKNAKIIGTKDNHKIYQSCLWDVSEYNIKVPNGIYDVTLKFCEPHYNEKGKRVFGVNLQEKKVIDKLDVFEKVGKNNAIDFTFDKIKVTDEKLFVEFKKIVEFPFISGIEIKGMTADSNQVKGEPFEKKINCGGNIYKKFLADLPERKGGDKPKRDRDLSAVDFYKDWCLAQFGPEISDELADFFVSIDGNEGDYSKNLRDARIPRPAVWYGGPGGIKPNENPWEEVKKDYDFVDKFAVMRPEIKGNGNLNRFDYWLNNFRYLRALGELGCIRGELDKAMKEIEIQVTGDGDPPDQNQNMEGRCPQRPNQNNNQVTEDGDPPVKYALELRIKLARLWEEMMTYQLAVTDTPGAMGTIANLELHVRKNAHKPTPYFLNCYDEKLAKISGKALPKEIYPTKKYLGEPRIIVPTKRSKVKKGEKLAVKVIILDNKTAKKASLFWRELGKNKFNKINLKHIARAVYSAELPPLNKTIEYYIKAKTADGKKLIWPATAPELNQTVVVIKKLT